VRGSPRKREAGEDFYLLGKIAKVAPLLRASGPVVRLRSRSSDRTPFGTGAGVARELASGEQLFYAPGCFYALGRFVACIDACAEHASVERFQSDNGGLDVQEWEAVSTPIFGAGGRETFEAASRQASSPAARRVRLHEWFDAFRTLKFIHALRNHVWPSLPWAEALARAPFACATESTSSPFVAERRWFAEHESAGPNAFGPASFGQVTMHRPSR